MKLEIGGVVFAIVMMSISSLFYIIFGQWLFSKSCGSFRSQVLRRNGHDFVPNSSDCDRCFSRIGGDALLYRSDVPGRNQQRLRSYCSGKGLSETAVLFKHVLRIGLAQPFAGDIDHLSPPAVEPVIAHFNIARSAKV